MDQINEYYYEKSFRNSRATLPEKHYSERCHYKTIYDCDITDTVNGIKLTGITVLLRICKCGSFASKKKLARRTKRFRLYEIEDGVEVHFSENCKYVQHTLLHGAYELRKYEYCGQFSPNYRYY